MAACALYVITLTLAFFLTGRQAFSVAGETNVRANILAANYSPDVRPIAVTNIDLAFNVLSVQSLNIQAQEISFAGWFTLVWTDPRLTWIPTSYENVTHIHTDDDHIWNPVVVVDNSVSDLTPIDDDNIPMRVTYQGEVSWQPPAIVTVSCDMDPTYFPFDKHTCSLQVTSFGYTLSELNLTVKGTGMMTAFYQANGEWALISHAASREEFDHDAERYARLLFEITMKRLPSYHGINLILPVLINSILVAFVFKLSPESGEKLGYTLTVLLAYVVMLTILAASVPSTSTSTSVLEVYVSSVLMMSTLSIILTTYIQNMYHRKSSHPVSPRVQCLARGMARLVCWKRYRDNGSSNSRSTLSESVEPSQPPVSTEWRGKTPIGWASPPPPPPPHDAQPPCCGEDLDDLSWQDVSVITDAFCFVVFLSIIMLMSLVILIVLGAQY